ncbi:MAG: ABC transporter permease [Rhodoluna sp.]|jgi:lipooligosaccharide transport system permease protein|nr:ABC transporter [Microbacteriaceae bacterium]NBS62189.1 ABC transporter [Microbacteriaceae bacterium]
MSLINTAVDSAIAIAEKRKGKMGAGVYSGRPGVVLERGYYALKSSTWMVVASGFVEPVFYLLAFGYGIGQFIDGSTDGAGNPITYAQFIAPALLATSAMNGAIYDSTWNVFFKMHFGKVYNGMLSTSMGTLDVALGEIGWALLRGLAYAIGFMAVVSGMGLIPSVWGLLAIPAAVLVAFGFASVGMGVTSYLKNHQQMQWIQFVMLPMFLFSGTFYPLSIYPEAVQWFIQALPLWQAIELIRGLTLGVLNWAMLGHALYFVAMIIGGLYFTTRRLTALFLR